MFDGLSCEIEKGSFLSIVGPSGCGKSTLLKLISGLETPTQGEVVFNGRRSPARAKGMIYVFQQYTKSIFPWRTVIQNVEFGLSSYKTLVRRKEARERCREYIRLVGLEGYENYYPYQLSGGMQQRVCIARALICEPDVLLMDEPFSAVDALTRAILQELILKIWETHPGHHPVRHPRRRGGGVPVEPHRVAEQDARRPSARMWRSICRTRATRSGRARTSASPRCASRLFSSIFLQEKGEPRPPARRH